MEIFKGKGGDGSNIVNSNNIILSTLMTYDVKKYEPSGIVRGTKVHGVSLFRSIVGNLSSLFGGKNDAINKKVDDVYNESIQELINSALIMYPGVKMISGIEVTLSEMKNIIICVATGTALILTSDMETNPSSASVSSMETSSSGSRQQTRRRRTTSIKK
uniref:Heavy metal-binding domain-containing protein n=1 Tax=viral metagenome TaxID=1070528 RepID=A0A6C0I2J3_9ZZZZ